MFDQPSGPAPTAASQTQRFPFTFPIPGSPANKTLDYSIYLPISYSPGYDIHNRLPYAEHYNFSIQRELSRSTVLTLAYVGTQGHRLISQYDANPGNAALCLQLMQEGATPDLRPQRGERHLYAAEWRRRSSAHGRAGGGFQPVLQSKQQLSLPTSPIPTTTRARYQLSVKPQI